MILPITHTQPSSHGLHEVLAPYDHAKVGEITLQSWAEVSAKLDVAQKAWQARREQTLPPHARAALLEKMAHTVELEAEHYAMLIAREGGKPIMDARVEVGRAIFGISTAAQEIGRTQAGEEIPMGLTPATMGRKAYTTREPIGVVVAISAFNHPLNLIVHQVVPAIAVGCPVIVKPALATPLTCEKFMQTVWNCGYQEAWAQVVHCDNNVAEKLATDPRVAMLNFIGSAKVGWWLRSQLPMGTRCVLEHGGNAPVIVLPYADQDAAITALVKGGFYHAGQVCVSTQRIFVPWAEAPGFSRKLAEAVEKLVVGNPVNDTTEVGPLIRTAEVDRMQNWVVEALAQGAKLITGGEKMSATCYRPTVLLDAPHDAKVSAEEIFGPIVCVYGYDDRRDAVARANASQYAFQAAVWGRDVQSVQETVAELDASTVLVNDHTAFRADWMPFGGRKASGLGMGGIPYTMQEYTQPKLVVWR